MPPRRISVAFALVLPLLAPSTHTMFRPTAPAARACADPAYRQFDFWLGRWDVSLPNGKRAGSNRIESILEGCALRETWSGAGGSNGTSYNAYDATRRRWHQTWVDNQGGLLLLEGGFADGRMTLEGETIDTAGHAQRQRIVWEETSPGQVRQLWETSGDGGATWTTAFDGRYVRR
jgi:hypothetical protein